MTNKYKVTYLGDEGYEFQVADNQTLLEAALKAGLDLPYNCRLATCGTCKCRLVEGEVHYGDADIYALTEEEQAAGFILPCQARPKSDLIISYPTSE